MSENKERFHPDPSQTNSPNPNLTNGELHQEHTEIKNLNIQSLIERNPNVQKPQYQHESEEEAKSSDNFDDAEQSEDNQEDQNQKSSNIEENRSEDEEQQLQDSNLKGDQKDEEEGRSEEEMKKQEPSGKKCFNKLCSSKKIYKKLRSKVEHAKYRFFCRQCYESYYSNDFCEFCEQIYSSTANSDDDDQWIGCDSCSRWNHIQCEKKFRNKDINQVKDEETQYLCLTCSYKIKEKNNFDSRPKGKKENSTEELKYQKPNIQISQDQRIHIFNKKIEALPSLEYFLQNYNFRLWINQNLIKDDLENLREATRRNQEESRKNKKVKTE